jgi:hypothetical protein
MCSGADKTTTQGCARERFATGLSPRSSPTACTPLRGAVRSLHPGRFFLVRRQVPSVELDRQDAQDVHPLGLVLENLQQLRLSGFSRPDARARTDHRRERGLIRAGRGSRRSSNKGRHVALTTRVKTVRDAWPRRSLLKREPVGRLDLAVAAQFSFRQLCFGRERVERTLEGKPAAVAKLEGGPGQRRLTETLLRKLLDFARRWGLGHPMTSLRRLFP